MLTKPLLNTDGGEGGGGAPADWTAQVDETFRPQLAAKGFKTPGDLAKSYFNLERILGTDRMPKPQPTWKPEQWDEFYSTIGRPKSPDSYVLPEVKLADGVTISPDRLKEWQGLFHKAGLTDSQAKMLFSTYLETLNKDAAGISELTQKEITEAENKLKADWGQSFQPNMEIARKAFNKFADPELLSYVNESKIGNDPRFLKLFHKIGQAMMEDSAKGGSGDFEVSQPTAAQDEIKKLQSDKEFMAKFMSGDPFAVERWNKLHIIAYPPEKK